MPIFVFTYPMPTGYPPGGPESISAWTAWFESMGESLAGIGRRVVEPAEFRDCAVGARLGGYSFVTADDLESADAAAKRSPAFDASGGVEVGMVTELSVDGASSGQGLSG